jgi:hypothetical protein
MCKAFGRAEEVYKGKCEFGASILMAAFFNNFLNLFYVEFYKFFDFFSYQPQ